jgi:NAD(P)-dependent dehydrogenase (short-subunit alcohol dehydrogenase family)
MAQIMSQQRFTGVRALVTGATSGIGQAISLALAGGGARVLAVGADEERTRAVGAALSGLGSGHHTVRGDLMSAAFLSELAHETMTWSEGRLSLLVCSAGHHEAASIEQTPATSFDATVAVNLRAPFLLTGSLLPAIRAARGMIAFVNSSIVKHPRPGIAAYAASKAGLRGFADCLRTEVSGDGVRVLSIFLGRTATPMQRARYGLEGLEYRPERLLQPDDVAAAVLGAFESPGEVTDLELRPLHRV